MFIRKAALRPVPPYAMVEGRHVDAVSQSLDDDDDALQNHLDRGFREFDARQAALSERAGRTLSGLHDELVQALGYFLVVTVYFAFREAFGARLREATEDDVGIAERTLEADTELRENDPKEPLETDDVVAMAQPAVLAFVQHHVDQALEQGGDEVDLEELEAVYRMVLVLVVTYSHVVSSPEGTPHDRAFAPS